MHSYLSKLQASVHLISLLDKRNKMCLYIDIRR